MTMPFLLLVLGLLVCEPVFTGGVRLCVVQGWLNPALKCLFSAPSLHQGQVKDSAFQESSRSWVVLEQWGGLGM